MKVLRLEDLPIGGLNTIITVGGFDGIHVAHRRLLRLMSSIGRSSGLKSVVITFELPPAIVLKKRNGEDYLLSTVDEKLELLRNEGVDYVLLLKFTDEVRKIKAEQFLNDICLRGLGARHIVLGFNHHFGHDKEGGPVYLIEKIEKLPLVVTILPPVIIDGVLVSSTKIRELLLSGNVELASKLLGRNYSIKGIVRKGRGIGREIGFPTANIDPPKKLIPKDGVYLVRVRTRCEEYMGLANIGRRPTFGEGGRSIEVHILDFDSNILGEEIEIYFLSRLRDEKKFDNIEELRRQIEKDVERAREILKGVYHAGS